MAEPAERQATYEDLLRVPVRLVAEIVNGCLARVGWGRIKDAHLICSRSSKRMR